MNIHLQVQLNGSIVSAHNTDPIFIIVEDKVTFIETDKQTYRPGDKIRIRFLILDKDIKVISYYIVRIILL